MPRVAPFLHTHQPPPPTPTRVPEKKVLVCLHSINLLLSVCVYKGVASFHSASGGFDGADADLAATYAAAVAVVVVGGSFVISSPDYFASALTQRGAPRLSDKHAPCKAVPTLQRNDDLICREISNKDTPPATQNAGTYNNYSKKRRRIMATMSISGL